MFSPGLQICECVDKFGGPCVRCPYNESLTILGSILGLLILGNSHIGTIPSMGHLEPCSVAPFELEILCSGVTFINACVLGRTFRDLQKP